MDVTYDLLSKGIDVWQQYDCWYTDKEVSNIEQIVEQYVSKYIDNNINNNNSNNIINNNITIVDIFVDDKNKYKTNINNNKTINNNYNISTNNNTIVESFSNSDKTDILSLVEQALADDEVEF